MYERQVLAQSKGSKKKKDTDADDATGPEQIAEMYERQVLAQSKGGKKKKDADVDDEFW